MEAPRDPRDLRAHCDASCNTVLQLATRSAGARERCLCGFAGLRIGTSSALPSGMRVSRSDTLSTTGVFHKMWRGHNREHVLETAEEKDRYLSALDDTKEKAVEGRVLFHSFCVMGNHT